MEGWRRGKSHRLPAVRPLISDADKATNLSMTEQQTGGRVVCNHARLAVLFRLA